jgi:hypothetical protein
MDPFNTLSTVAATRMIPPLRDASPAKVASCVLVASTDLEEALDAAKEDTRGAGTPSAMMAYRSAKSPGRQTMVGGHMTPLKVGQPSPARQSSPCAWGHGSHPFRALSPCPMIRKERQSVMPTCLYGGPHSEEGDHPMPTGGPIEQQ